MNTEETVQDKQEPRRLEKDWAETEWFSEWLRLARREYQGTLPPRTQFRQAA